MTEDRQETGTACPEPPLAGHLGEPIADVLVLAYHAVSDRWGAVTTVTPGQLHAQMTHLAARGYVGATFHDALSTPPPGKVLAVTFDDAHRSVFERALPILRAFDVPATVFAPTDYIGTGEPTGWEGFAADASGPHRDELICMGWDELRSLADAGWEIGSHTCSHPHLTRLTRDEMDDELNRSREVIEDRLQLPCPSLAYPYSVIDATVVQATLAAGYSYAATIPLGSAISLPLRWSRVGVSRTDSPARFRMLTSPAFRDFRATSSGDAVAGILQVARGMRGRLAGRSRR